MALVELDIQTKVVGEKDRVFVLFPGDSHRFYSVMNDTSRVFLDFPALPLDGIQDVKQIRDWGARIGLSEKVRVWHNKKQPADSVPSRDLSDYGRYGLTDGRALFAGLLSELLFGAREGELVIVPGPGYWTDVLIGEFAGPAGRIATARVPRTYPGEQVPARQVRWLARAPKGQLSPAIVRRLQTPNPFTTLEKSLRDEVYRLAYSNYAYDGMVTSKILTSNPEFTTLDDYNIQLFINTIVGAMTAEAAGGFRAGSLSVEKAIALLDQNPELIPDLALNINSPGDITIYSQRIVPLVIASLMALALSGEAIAGAKDVKVRNGPNQADACAVQVDASVKSTLDLMGLERWKAACEQLKGTGDRTGLKPPVKVIKPKR